MPRKLVTTDMGFHSHDGQRALYQHGASDQQVRLDKKLLPLGSEWPAFIRVTIEGITPEEALGPEFSPVMPFVGMGWCQAFRLMRKGNKIARRNWNGKGLYLFYVHSGQWIDNGVNRVLCPFVALNTVDNKIVPWTMSQSDMLAEDWMVVQ